MSEGSENLESETIHCTRCGYETVIFDDGDGLSLPECPNGCTLNGSKFGTTMIWGGAPE